MSADKRVEASVDTAAARSTNSVDKLAAIDVSPATRLDTSIDITSDTLVSMEVTVDSKPEISAITRPLGAVMVALVKIRSDCLSNTIFVVDINLKN